VFKFNLSGKFVRQIGRKGGGKGKFKYPNNIVIKNSFLMTEDVKRKRIEYFNLDGLFTKSLKISKFENFAVNEEGLIFTAPFFKDSIDSLIYVYSKKGKKLTSFGEPNDYRHSVLTLNSRQIAVNKKGEVFVAFTYFPVLRKYSPAGELLTEFEIDNNIMQAKKNFNLRKLGEGIRAEYRRAGYVKIIAAVKVFDEKIYLLSYYPRLEILEIGEDGKVNVTYWKDFNDIYEADDFLVQEINGKKKFYLLQSFPALDIDVLVPSDHPK
jgi:hypothetical protein